MTDIIFAERNKNGESFGMKKSNKTLKIGKNIKKSSLLSGNRTILGDTRGAALLEFAFTFPVLALLLFGMIEIGWYMMRYQAVSRALSITAADIQASPSTTTQAVANNTGSLIAFGTGDNYICAQAYQTYAHALAANPYCTSGAWALGVANPSCSDTGHACTTPYYVGIVAHAAAMSLSGFASSIFPSGTAINPTPFIVTVGATGGGGGGGSSLTIPICPAGQTLTSTDGTTLTCISGGTGTIGGGCYDQGTSCHDASGQHNGTISVGWGNAAGSEGNWGCGGIVSGHYISCAACPNGYTDISTGAGKLCVAN